MHLNLERIDISKRIDVGYGFDQPGLFGARAAHIHSGEDVFDAVDAVGTRESVCVDDEIVEAIGGEKDYVAGLGQGMEAFQGDDVYGIAVLEDELKAVRAEEISLTGQLGLSPGLPGLIVDAERSGQSQDEADDGGDRTDRADWQHEWFLRGNAGRVQGLDKQ
jgi:hypothetical protein